MKMNASSNIVYALCCIFPIGMLACNLSLLSQVSQDHISSLANPAISQNQSIPGHEILPLPEPTPAVLIGAGGCCP